VAAPSLGTVSAAERLVVSDSPLTDAEQAQLRDLAAEVAAQDGAPPLSDQAASRVGVRGGVDLAVREDGRLAGYARLERDDDGSTAELLARPGAVAALLDAASARAAGARLLVWSHGSRSRLVAALAAAGFDRVRELHQLRRDLAADGLPPDPGLPPGVLVRAFRPGQDDAAWLALNAAAFAAHPEQGRWTQDDLAARMAESWFDPAGFFLAERAGQPVAFHWTKIHPGDLGEVYVLGVAPEAQGLGLGRALLLRGLHHLAQRGCSTVSLYVDGDNIAALALYERSGFVRYDVDRQWTGPAS